MGVLSGVYRKVFERLRGRGLGLGLFTKFHELVWDRWLAPEAVEVNGYRLFLPRHDESLADSLRMGRPWEPEMTVEFQARVKPGMVVADIGANVGYYTVLASRLVGPSGKVLAFEPAPENLELLQRNIEANGCRNVEVHPCAAGARSGRMTLYRCATNPGAHSLVREMPGGDSQTVDVAALDELLPGAKVDVVKIDVEGGELPALEGMPKLLQGVSVMFFECAPHVLQSMNLTEEQVLAKIAQAGFSISRIDPLNLLCLRR